MNIGNTKVNNLNNISHHKTNDETTKYFIQGPRIYQGYPTLVGFFNYELIGATIIKGNRVQYNLKLPELDLNYKIIL